MAQIPDITPPAYVTLSATAAVEALLADADRLGLTWRLRPGTVAGSGLAAPESVPVVVDGDAAQARARSMTGAVVAGQRVWVVQIPPAGLYVLGTIGQPRLSPGALVARLRRNANQEIANGGAGEFVDFDTADYLPFGGWSASTNPDRFTPPWAGIWMFNGRVVYASNATSRRFAAINTNGSMGSTGTRGSTSLQAPAAGSCQVQAAGSSPMNGTSDYVSLRALQNSGGPLDITGTDGGSFLEAYWLGPDLE